MSDKPTFPAAIAGSLANRLVVMMETLCEPQRCVVAGSLRRGKRRVGDIEVLYVPRVEVRPVESELLALPMDLVECLLKTMLEGGFLEKRVNRRGFQTWGDLIKLARHVESGIPVDFFRATQENWFNYLVCRTGPKESNEAIATAAQTRGLKWKPYGAGFYWANCEDQLAVPVLCEADVFRAVGLLHLPPEER